MLLLFIYLLVMLLLFIYLLYFIIVLNAQFKVYLPYRHCDGGVDFNVGLTLWFWPV